MRSINEKEGKVGAARECFKLGMGVALALFGMFLVGFSIVSSPVGAINAGVIGVFCAILFWVGAMFGIDSHAKLKMNEQEMDFELKEREREERMMRMRMKMPEENDV